MERERLKFYHSAPWKRASRLYMLSKNYVCERCGGVGEICHHREHITGADIGDLEKTLGQDNLECLCIGCHNAAHGGDHNMVVFDAEGRACALSLSEGLREFYELQEGQDDF